MRIVSWGQPWQEKKAKLIFFVNFFQMKSMSCSLGIILIPFLMKVMHELDHKNIYCPQVQQKKKMMHAFFKIIFHIFCSVGCLYRNERRFLQIFSFDKKNKHSIKCRKTSCQAISFVICFDFRS